MCFLEEHKKSQVLTENRGHNPPLVLDHRDTCLARVWSSMGDVMVCIPLFLLNLWSVGMRRRAIPWLYFVWLWGCWEPPRDIYAKFSFGLEMLATITNNTSQDSMIYRLGAAGPSAVVAALARLSSMVGSSMAEPTPSCRSCIQRTRSVAKITDGHTASSASMIGRYARQRDGIKSTKRTGGWDKWSVCYFCYFGGPNNGYDLIPFAK